MIQVEWFEGWFIQCKLGEEIHGYHTNRYGNGLIEAFEDHGPDKTIFQPWEFKLPMEDVEQCLVMLERNDMFKRFFTKKGDI